MKKILSAVLAASMVASMGVASFAAIATEDRVKGINDTAYEFDGTDYEGPFGDMIPYGKTAYYEFTSNNTAAGNYAVKQDAVKGVSIKKKFEEGSSLVEKIEIVKKKNPVTYAYYLAVSFKDSTSTKTADVIGEITMRKGGTDGFNTDNNEVVLVLNERLGYGTAGVDGVAAEVTSTKKIYDFTKGGFSKTDDMQIDLGTNGATGYMIVDTSNQSSVLISVSTKYNADIAAKYPEANLDFVTGNGASFNKIGELTIFADKDSFLYEVKDGILVPVKNTYDEYEEAFKVKTRTIGQYVISDVEVKSTVVEESSSTTTESDKTNPGTGAIA